MATTTRPIPRQAGSVLIVGIFAFSLVRRRFDLHLVEVPAREPGSVPAHASVHAAVAQALRQQSFITALRQYRQLLAAQADLQELDLEAAETPLVP